VVGAALSSKVVLILGLANLVADGFAMRLCHIFGQADPKPTSGAWLGTWANLAHVAPSVDPCQITYPLALTIYLAAPEAAPSPFGSRAIRRITMHRTKSLSIKSVTVAGIAASLMLGFAGVTLSPAPARAVVYCQYVAYPHGCVARAGVVLRPRPVARAAVRHNAGGNLNGGVNRVGVRR
jgi:hypothetical protein